MAIIASPPWGRHPPARCHLSTCRIFDPIKLIFDVVGINAFSIGTVNCHVQDTIRPLTFSFCFRGTYFPLASCAHRVLPIFGLELASACGGGFDEEIAAARLMDACAPTGLNSLRTGGPLVEPMVTSAHGQTHVPLENHRLLVRPSTKHVLHSIRLYPSPRPNSTSEAVIGIISMTSTTRKSSREPSEPKVSRENA
ncbi:hypothetical protein M405DRAFT_200503 [Rhizopogon salebrosus TDB-379]|nr:hypothetical protein M405DRAFT_200503 [Rhizopogon salebrosus TDB-379]